MGMTRAIGRACRSAAALPSPLLTRWRVCAWPRSDASFIADSMGAKVAGAAEDGDAVLTATFDLEALAGLGNNWFVFRDGSLWESGDSRRTLELTDPRQGPSALRGCSRHAYSVRSTLTVGRHPA